MIDINDDIWVLDESLISQSYYDKNDVPKEEEDGPVEQLIKSDLPEETPKKNPCLVGEEIIEITKTPFVIGKSERADFKVSDTYVSRRHCRITEKEGEYFIEDLNSTNGTFVDGYQIDRKVRLEPDSEIKLADRRYIWQQ